MEVWGRNEDISSPHFEMAVAYIKYSLFAEENGVTGGGENWRIRRQQQQQQPGSPRLRRHRMENVQVGKCAVGGRSISMRYESFWAHLN